MWKLGRFALLSSVRHKEFQIHGGWVQTLVVSDTHPLIAQPRPPTRRPGSEECGYIWNANDAAPASKTVDVKPISLAIDAVAEQQCSLDACSTGPVASAGGRAVCGVPPNTVTTLFPVSSSECSVIGVFYNQYIDQYNQYMQ